MGKLLVDIVVHLVMSIYIVSDNYWSGKILQVVLKLPHIGTVGLLKKKTMKAFPKQKGFIRNSTVVGPNFYLHRQSRRLTKALVAFNEETGPFLTTIPCSPM